MDGPVGGQEIASAVRETPMPSPRAVAQGAALSLVVALACMHASGCAWLRWRDVATTHADLMERLALDGADALASPRAGLEPGDIERLRYPLARARAFARSSHRRFEGAAWLEHFDRMLAAYGGLVDHLDKSRTRSVGDREKERARLLAQAVTDAAQEVREALAEPPATSWLSPSRPGNAPARGRSVDA
jgi:hypothetical protein